MYYLLKIVKIYLTPTPLLKARGKNYIVMIKDTIDPLPLAFRRGVGVR